MSDDLRTLDALELAHDAALAAVRRDPTSACVDEARRATERYEAALRKRLETTAGDHGRRLKLGRLLFDADRIDEAIGELQRAKQHDDVCMRAAAGYFLGYCFLKKRIARLAVQELLAARAGLDHILTAAGSPEARDIAYLLGRIYESAGKNEEALREYQRVAASGAIAPPPDDGLTGTLAPLRPDDPPRVPPAPGSAAAEPDRAPGS